MRTMLTKPALILMTLLALTVVSRAEQLIGTIGSASGPNWQSSWIDLAKAIDFKRGESLKVKLRGNAENIILRLLPSGAHPSSSNGIVGGVRKMPKDGVLKIQIPEDRSSVVQISVHGGQKAWDISLGRSNGPVFLVGIDRGP